jgi:hypothetical protein
MSGHRPGDGTSRRTGPRARGLINDADPRIEAVERQPVPELVEPVPPERLRYLAALAVAVCDEHGGGARPGRSGERADPARPERSRAYRAAVGALAGVVLVPWSSWSSCSPRWPPGRSHCGAPCSETGPAPRLPRTDPGSGGPAGQWRGWGGHRAPER